VREIAYVEAKGGPYCKGCGHPLVLRSLGSALEHLELTPADLAVVTDIGCVGLADSQVLTPHTVHTTHGRSTAFASGISLADSILGQGRLKTIVLIGDGGAMIGISHLINGALLNPDVTVLVHNNFLFGMTGGQNSAFSPVDFVTATTSGGSFVPPLDLARVLLAARAPFVARMVTGDRDLADVIERAIAHPGFAVVEILELCTAYGTRWNPLTGAKLREVADEAGYALGVLRDEPRPTFGAAYRERHAAEPAEAASENGGSPAFAHSLERTIGLVLAGSASERVQTAAKILASAALSCGLYATQKNDYPVTVGTGFSVSEVILAPEPILYTGIETPDAVLVVSQDGVRELERSGVFERVGEETLVLVDEEVELPALAAEPVRLPLRAEAGAKQAALAAVAAWVERDGAIPAEALRAAVASRLGRHADEAAPALAVLK
jgi:pyruvate/2-oxoacid:ferredoxin oxidoreductase beta subunit/Pyruvate/2-oxoacid:ferredoxin oxidoreductase gamma subunit